MPAPANLTTPAPSAAPRPIAAGGTLTAAAAAGALPAYAPAAPASEDVAWLPFENTYGAEWELSGVPAPPYSLRLTDTFDRVLVLKWVACACSRALRLCVRVQPHGALVNECTPPSPASADGLHAALTALHVGGGMLLRALDGTECVALPAWACLRDVASAHCSACRTGHHGPLHHACYVGAACSSVLTEAGGIGEFPSSGQFPPLTIQDLIRAVSGVQIFVACMRAACLATVVGQQQMMYCT